MIRLEYQLVREDHVTFQLYIASKSERIKKKRRRTKFRLPLAYLLFAVIIYFVGEISLSLIFLLIGILWFLIYPKYEKRMYEKHYQSFVEENFKTESDPEVVIELTEEKINATDKSGNSSIKIDAITAVDEIKDYFFIKLSPGQGLILPKSKIENMIEFENWLNRVLEKYQIPKNIDLDWKWK
ncbi:MAG: YcxB family protein [Bacteroidales bacterium]|nr:YcxB family protein [Bacteroidales bacterium]